MVRARGLEPPWGCPHTDLNRTRLPIPPRPRIGAYLSRRGLILRLNHLMRNPQFEKILNFFPLGRGPRGKEGRAHQLVWLCPTRFRPRFKECDAPTAPTYCCALSLDPTNFDCQVQAFTRFFVGARHVSHRTKSNGRVNASARPFVGASDSSHRHREHPKDATLSSTRDGIGPGGDTPAVLNFVSRLRRSRIRAELSLDPTNF